MYSEVVTASSEQQARLLMLCHPEMHETSSDITTLVSQFWPRASNQQSLAKKLETLLAVWLLNCFEHSEDPVGFSTFFLPSFLSHSCRPNCMWHYEGDSFVLRARESIAAGDEVTVSYLSEEALLESTASRRKQLEVTTHFTCECDRCTAPVDRVRGFSCPSCKVGECFLNFGSSVAIASIQGACQQCGFLPNSSQVAEMCSQEMRVEDYIQEWDRKALNVAPDTYLTDAVALKLEANLAGLLSEHHWLRDRAGRHLIAYYEATGRADLALPLAKLSVRFATDTYPGCSALHAWALETQGDLRLRLDGFKLQGPSAVEAPVGLTPEMQQKAWQDVGPIYAEALQILGTLFGREHDFYTTMQDKYNSLSVATRR